MADKPKGEKRFEIEEDLSKVEIPEILPVLPLRGIVIFPSQIHPFLVSRRVVAQADRGVSARTRRVIALAAQKNPEEEKPASRGIVPARHRRAHPQDAALSRSERARAGAGTGANRARRVHAARAVLPRAREAAAGADFTPTRKSTRCRRTWSASFPSSSRWCRTCPTSCR